MTDERIIVGVDDTVAQQTAILAERGLSLADENRMSADGLSDLRMLSVTSEGA
jgi:hypothetical protein